MKPEQSSPGSRFRLIAKKVGEIRALKDEAEQEQGSLPGDASAPERKSLIGYYWIGVRSTLVSIFVVMLLNAATPLDLTQRLVKNLSGFNLGLALLIGFRLLLIILVALVPFLLSMRALLRPIAECLTKASGGHAVPDDLMDQARRRLLNLPFLLIPINIGLWIVIPAVVFSYPYLTGRIGMQTAISFSIRASMVGFVASAISFYAVEAHSRRKLIPFFFPHGRLYKVPGTARISISRRIRMFFRMGSMIPMTILVVTLLTLQMEVDSAAITAKEYGKGIVIFTLVLFAWVFIAGGVLNRFVSRSIVNPLKNILSVVARLREGDYDNRVTVVSNDEIGVLGDASNAMIRGLAEREMIRTAFGKYVSPQIRDEILSGRIPLDGEVKEVTVLFADLRDFTPLVGSTPAKELVRIINGYFEEMAQAVQDNGGLILQFIGDEIEAVFGAPLPLDDHPASAARAALEMRNRLELFNKKLEEQGRGPLRHGIGIYTGKALAANIGSPDRLSYALVGETVNLASRLQDLTKELGHDILISANTRNGLGDEFTVKPLPATTVKGKSQPLEIYALA